MSADPPEITTNEEWRILMVAARTGRKWKQADLATRVTKRSKMHASQALISQIESGVIGSSRLVRPICEELSIPEPMHFQDEMMKQWWLTGHLMRGENMALFKQHLELAKSTLTLTQQKSDDEEDETPKPSPSKHPAK